MNKNNLLKLSIFINIVIIVIFIFINCKDCDYKKSLINNIKNNFSYEYIVKNTFWSGASVTKFEYNEK